MTIKLLNGVNSIKLLHTFTIFLCPADIYEKCAMLVLIKCLNPEKCTTQNSAYQTELAMLYLFRRVETTLNFTRKCKWPKHSEFANMGASYESIESEKEYDPKLIARIFEHVECASPVDWYTQYVMPVKMAAEIQSIQTLDGKQLDAARALSRFTFESGRGKSYSERLFNRLIVWQPRCILENRSLEWFSFFFFFSISSVRVCRSVLQSEEIKHVYKWNAAHELYIYSRVNADCDRIEISHK